MNANSYNSEHWWDDINNLAQKFVYFVNVQSKQRTPSVILAKQEKEFDQVKITYRGNLRVFKRKVYGKKASEHNIDRHKIIALYIKSFLEVSPFYVKSRNKPFHIRGSNKQEKTQKTIGVQDLPNEFFSFELMKLILTAWNQSKEGIHMDKNEKKWFIILLNHLKLNISTLDVLSLAQIIYYIEDKYISIHT